jgi:hypothetical protein
MSALSLVWFVSVALVVVRFINQVLFFSAVGFLVLGVLYVAHALILACGAAVGVFAFFGIVLFVLCAVSGRDL